MKRMVWAAGLNWVAAMDWQAYFLNPTHFALTVALGLLTWGALLLLRSRNRLLMDVGLAVLVLVTVVLVWASVRLLQG